MVDLQGKLYRQLENAFRHRTEYVEDCSCHGHPWEEQALAQHRTYAEAEKAPKDQRKVTERSQVRNDVSRREPRRNQGDRWARGTGRASD